MAEELFEQEESKKQVRRLRKRANKFMFLQNGKSKAFKIQVNEQTVNSIVNNNCIYLSPQQQSMSKFLDPFNVPAQLNNLGVLIVAYVAKNINQETQCVDPHHSHFLEFIYYGSIMVSGGTFLLTALYVLGVIDFCINKVCPCGEVCLTLNTLGIFLLGIVYHFVATIYGLIVLFFGTKSPCIELEMFKQITGIIYAIWLCGIIFFLLYHFCIRKAKSNRKILNERFISV